MDDMQDWELDYLIDNFAVSYKVSWEQTRNLMWAILAPNMKRKMDAKKIMPMPWDLEDEKRREEEYVPLTEKELEFENKQSDQLAQFLSRRLH